jgi:hypothetical protein
MALPKIEHVMHSLKLPVSNTTINFRPYLVKEEKILLVAKESGEEADILRAVKQVITNCVVDEKFDVDELCVADAYFLFLRMRALSVDSKVVTRYIDNEDRKSYDFPIDLNKIVVKQEKPLSNTIKASPDVTITLRYPRAIMLGTPPTDDTIDYDLIISCIENIFFRKVPHDVKNCPRDEMVEFIDNLGVKTLETIIAYIQSAPRLDYTIEYKNSNGNQRSIKLETLSDFFF